MEPMLVMLSYVCGINVAKNRAVGVIFRILRIKDCEGEHDQKPTSSIC